MIRCVRDFVVVVDTDSSLSKSVADIICDDLECLVRKDDFECSSGCCCQLETIGTVAIKADIDSFILIDDGRE